MVQETETHEVTYSFETDGIQSLMAGDILGTVDLGSGFEFEILATRDVRGSGDAMIFDSNNPTGGDDDLGSGTGNLLVISEDGNSSDPDDNMTGGTLTFDFTNPLNVEDVLVVDAFEGDGQVEAFDVDGNSVGLVEIPKLGRPADGVVDTLALGFEDVSKRVFTFNESGAIDDLRLSKPADKEFQMCKEISNIVVYLDCDGPDGDEITKI